MRKFPRTALALVAVAVAASVAVTATSASTKKAAATAEVCVLLPDSKSSVRWETQDRRFLAAAFQRLGDSVQHRQRRGQRFDAAQPGAAVPDQRGEGHPAGQPRLRLRRGDREARQVQGRADGRLRPPDAEGLGVVLRVVRQRVGRQAAGAGPHQLPDQQRRDQEEAGHRHAQRLPDRQQRDPVRAGLQLDPEPEVQERDAEEGPGSVGAGLGQPEGPDDLPGHADPDQEQHPGRRGGQRRPRQRGHLGPEVGRPQADPGHRPGRDGAGRPEHPRPAGSA